MNKGQRPIILCNNSYVMEEKVMNRHYVLLATDGYIYLPTDSDVHSDKRKQVYVFGFLGGLYKVYDKSKTLYINNDLNIDNPSNYRKFANMRGRATIPSPIIWGDSGDKIIITIVNLGLSVQDLEGVNTIHFHGGDLISRIDEITKSGTGIPVWKDFSKKPESMTYSFNTRTPGGYMYHCHADTSAHVQMGMYGAIVIYPSYKSLKDNGIVKDYQGRWFSNGVYCENIPKSSTNRNFAYNSINSYFDKEYVLLLSDIDTKWHEAIEQGRKFNTVSYKPNYWLINGKSYPDTLCSCTNSRNEIDYESYVHIRNGELVLLRVMNIGYQMVPWHINGYHFYVIGKDASPSPFLSIAQLVDSGETKISFYDMFEKGYTASVGPGETYDLLISAENKRHLDDINSPKYYPMHNYDDYKIANDGSYPGGQLTYMQVDD